MKYMNMNAIDTLPTSPKKQMALFLKLKNKKAMSAIERYFKYSESNGMWLLSEKKKNEKKKTNP